MLDTLDTELIPVIWQSSRRWLIVINPLAVYAYVTFHHAGPRLRATWRSKIACSVVILNVHNIIIRTKDDDDDDDDDQRDPLNKCSMTHVCDVAMTREPVEYNELLIMKVVRETQFGTKVAQGRE